MKKQFIIFLISIFVLGLTPVNFSNAITQNQIDAEVQIICPDNYGNWYSGSGTIISSKGIIITNKHVVTDARGEIIKYCRVGVGSGVNYSADFSKGYVAETKYYSTDDNLDAALLYIVSGDNDFIYFNIFDSNSTNLKKGDTIEVIGYPAYNDLKLTQTNGEFVGFSNYFNNYLETTAYINHGNSGGAAYNYNNFVGLPTFILTTDIGVRYYYLSINSVKNWFTATFGDDYLTDILGYKPTITPPTITLPEDNTPPVIKNAPRDVFWYKTFDDNGNVAHGIYTNNNNPWKDLYTSGTYRKIQITMKRDQFQWSMSDMDKDSGLYSIIYSYSNDIHKALNGGGTERVINYVEISHIDGNFYIAELTPMITLPDKYSTYYINIRFKDKSGNVSEPYILTYSYEKDSFLGLKNIKFYSDPNYSNMVGNYNFTMKSSDWWNYPEYHQYCVTKYKNIYVKWEYDNNYAEYIVNHYHDNMIEMSAADSLIKGGITVTKSNKYSVTNLNLANNDYSDYGDSICYNNNCNIEGKVSSLLLKPKTSEGAATLEGKHIVVKFVYNPSISFGLLCGGEDISRGLNNFKRPYYILSQGQPLVKNDNQIINNSLLNRLKGYILLQVESHGEAWYVNPSGGKRYYMKDGATAYQMMRNFGLGITNADLAKMPKENEKNNYPSLVNRLKGKILLQMEEHGEAWYVNPKTGYRHYMKDGEAAYNLMRYYSLGISNKDLEKIPEGNL